MVSIMLNVEIVSNLKITTKKYCPIILNFHVDYCGPYKSGEYFFAAVDETSRGPRHTLKFGSHRG